MSSTKDEYGIGTKVSAAVFYGVSSVAIMTCNKVVLTSYEFPSAKVLALSQIIVTMVVITVASFLGLVSFPVISGGQAAIFRKVFPLPMLYVLNLIAGLMATKELSLPMFAVLRRFSIWMTMVGEGYLLNRYASFEIKCCVGAMIFGAVVAAADDLKKLDSKELGTFGLMFYNCLYCFPVAAYMVFSASSLLGFILTLAIFKCTQINSPLTTTVIGCLKNVLISYGGMFIGGDYVFSLVNFLGLNISIVGSLVYSYYAFLAKAKASKPSVKTISYRIDLPAKSDLEGGAAGRSAEEGHAGSPSKPGDTQGTSTDFDASHGADGLPPAPAVAAGAAAAFVRAGQLIGADGFGGKDP
eukprot:gene12703-8258_t